jgi:hypothetical protein
MSIAGGFTRDNPATAKITGMSRDLVGTHNAPPNLNLPWYNDIYEHVTVHNKTCTMTRYCIPYSKILQKEIC